MGKVLGKLWNFISTVVVVLVVIFAVLLVGVRLFGIQVYSVISGSMEPEYHVGSLIYVKEVLPETVEAGDVITFVLPDDTPATHRVVRVDKDNRCFYTKGDANDIEDGAPVHFNNLIGTPVFTIPYLGYAAHYIQHPPGMYVAIAAGALLLILVFVPDLFKSDKKKSKKDKTDKTDKGDSAAPAESIDAPTESASADTDDTADTAAPADAEDGEKTEE